MLVRIGIDDTDSHRGGCTTYVGYRLVKEILRKYGDILADYPRLIRLNPYVPFKTRGNAAVALVLDAPEGAEGDLWELAVKTVSEGSDVVGKTSPGVVMAVGQVPERARRVYRLALSQIVPRSVVERVGGLRTWGGRGVIGATAAVGAELPRSTFELLAYREGGRPPIGRDLVAAMELLTYPYTFHNLDGRRVLIEPRGPDPVLYGIRGLSPPHLVYAARFLEANGVRPAGWVIYRTNQATDAHVELGALPDRPLPYSVYRARALVLWARRHRRHVFAGLSNGLVAVAYRHLGKIAATLERCVGCYVELRGGVKPRGDGLYLYIESMEVIYRVVRSTPRCPYCGGALESMGRGKGRRCVRCGTVFKTAEVRYLLSTSERGLHVPRPGEWRHLFKPPDLDPTPVELAGKAEGWIR
ncbi:tRNA(Ile2) 2-agmatinylcytidine synthetase [Thermoproteus sp. CP80]|uniref:tRNA(Ile)(2)-agmatinylcytidine synthase n=1 Tax=Thermoproteus sp. CP80 TaxID=1650659 RepID=UPI0009BE5687|nr:tRNA(Ile)(2)-agmatinylcytidine synthase [Thermoproteus sp. CP80]PLC64738.1 tRNA(Ile2) 2-agmatinylcytidine synthetase [Thermoproteus sp. CP80]